MLELEIQHDQILKAFQAAKIISNVHQIPVQLRLYYKKICLTGTELRSTVESTYEKILNVPIFIEMGIKDVCDIYIAFNKVDGGQ